MSFRRTARSVGYGRKLPPSSFNYLYKNAISSSISSLCLLAVPLTVKFGRAFIDFSIHGFAYSAAV